MLAKKTRLRRLIFVHGHALKPREAVMRDLSLTAIRAGLQRDYPESVETFNHLGFDFAYYADLTNPVLTAAGQSYDEELDVGDRQNALRALQAIVQRKKFGFRQYDSLPGKSAMREFLADFVAPILGALGLTMPLLSKVAPDFAAYLRNDKDIAVQIRQRIRDLLIPAMERGDRVMLAAHGMGGVAVFDVLWELSRDPQYSDYADVKIDTLVTMGAPLCDNFLRRYLLGAGSKGLDRYPGNIISWQNLAAEDDFVCHDGTVADDFSVMLRERIVSQINDYRVYNQAVRYGKSNPHSSIGYIIHPRFSKLLNDWMLTEID